MSGLVAFLGSVCLRRTSISSTSVLGKSKEIEESKLFLIFNHFLIPSSNENNLTYLLSSEWGKIR